MFSPAYTEAEMRELCTICGHISFNSISQLEKHRKIWETAPVSVGLLVNPEYSASEDHEIYDPCAPCSRLGIRLSQFPRNCPEGWKGCISILCVNRMQHL